ncbi:hypothetical protein FFK22_032690 [Mycobacterium sp. KBS0706]|uniref:hypothetical protein n=1 Tax=Mycobacterium sp. KBS0706 TaxID=2578109 RepID=UPI00110F6C86|nr:hypothetical protein [Mycobacterium sp. KBS0706]TSD84430.1 hypothetical protein FFK22_032690 [Mycobacterium sp. KBS0706]
MADIDALRTDLTRHPSERDETQLVPIVLPPALLQLNWPGPIVQIGRLPFVAAWAVLGEDNMMTYVNGELAAYWENAGIDWRAKALDNLMRMTGSRPASHQKVDEGGRPLMQIMLHEDGVGPSRLLLPHLFDDTLGPDYQVAIPERTCAIAYRADLTPEQKADVDGAVEGCFTRGTEPMSADRFDASLFWVPLQAGG